MAKNNFTFQAALKLNSAGFKRGVNEVKTALAGLKSSFLSLAGALGAGLGFTQLISQVKDTATQLSVAKSVLENVSKVTKQYTDGVNKGTVELSNYSENLEYVKRLSRDYSQDLVSLMENFAQFHAACEKTNLDLEQQKDVYESLTKAAAYYHMSADRTKDMMTAITQMMSKGKVSAEELRRQLGNALPGAFNLMAAAMGVSTAELEDMMKKGQVISSEVLPRFAAMLNTVTKNANFDSLQMSLNKLRNTWYDFVERTGAEGLFKKIIDGADNVLASITKNINAIKDTLKGLVAAILSMGAFKVMKRQSDEYFANLENQLTKSVKQFEKQHQKLVRVHENIKVHNTAKGDVAPNSLAGISKEDLDNITKYNDNLLQLAKIRRELGRPNTGPGALLSDKDLQTLARVNRQLKEAQAGSVKLGSVWTKVGKTITGAFKNIAMQVEGILMSMGAMAVVSAIIGGITAIISHVKRVREEWEKIRNIVNDYHEDVKKTDEGLLANEKILRSNLAIIQDTTKEERQRLGALKELNKQMGTSFNSDALDKTKQAYKDIVAEVERWIEATKLQAKIQVQARKGAEADALIEEKKAKIVANEAKLNNFKWWDQQGREHKGVDPGSWGDRVEYNKIKREIDMDKEAIKNLTTVVNEADQALKELGVELYDLYDESLNAGGGGNNDDKTETDIQKTFKKFTEEKQALINQLKEQAITQEEYNEEFDNLVTKFWKEAAATGKMSIEAILAKMDKGQTLTKMEQWYKDLYEAAQKAAFNATARAAAEAIDKALDESIKEADKKLDEEMQEWIDKAIRNIEADTNALLAEKPGKTKRDHTFDYKKSQSDIKSEQLDIDNTYIKELEDAIDTIISKYDSLEDASEDVRKKLSEWQVELSLAKKQAATLEEAMKFSKIQEDIEELKNSINDAVYSGIKNMASSMDRVIKGMETLKNTMDDTDSTGWEKFMAVFNELVQITDTFISALRTVQTIQDMSNKMDEAEAALISTKISLLEKELLLRQAIAAQKAIDVKQTEQQTGANIAEAASAKISASAKAGEAVAGATASGAKLPFPYNLAAIAAGIAAVLAALAAMSKFANGGIVGGNSYSGDKQMARVNSGEMILNKAQQANLWSIINGKKGISGDVQFKIRGTDLIGAINNEMNRRRG